MLDKVTEHWPTRTPQILAQLRDLGELIVVDDANWRLLLRVPLRDQAKRELGALTRAIGVVLEISGVRYE